MRKNLTHAIMALCALLLAAPALADGNGSAGRDAAAAPLNSTPQTANAPTGGRSGEISLMDGGLTLNVPSDWRFYPAEEAYAFLQRTGATAPSGTVLGLIAKSNVNPHQQGSWATIVSYDAIGYVQPETSSGLADANFEQAVRSARQMQNRTFEGFAAAPAFEATDPSLMWGERAAAPGATGADLRVEEKVLGRYGVGSLTSIGSADQMDEINAAARDLKSMMTFPAGRKASDFQPATDHVSAYSVPALVTGVPATQPRALAEATTTGQAQTGFGGLPAYFPWVALGVIVLAGAGFLAFRRRRPDDEV